MRQRDVVENCGDALTFYACADGKGAVRRALSSCRHASAQYLCNRFQQATHPMAARNLSLAPAIDPTAKITDCTLGAYTEVGARTKLLEVRMADYSYVVNDSDIAYATIGKFCSIA